MKHSIKNKGIKRVTTLLARNVIVNSQTRKTLRIIWNTIIALKSRKNPWKQSSRENATPKKILLKMLLNLMLMGKKQRLFPYQLTRKAMPIKCILAICARWGIFYEINFWKPNSIVKTLHLKQKTICLDIWRVLKYYLQKTLRLKLYFYMLIVTSSIFWSVMLDL